MPCYNSTVLNAPVQTVWKTIADFHDLSWAPGVITSCESIGGYESHELGARRVLNGSFDETLLSMDEEHHMFSYRINDGPGPVAKDKVKNYVGRVKLLPVTRSDRTFIEWASTYDGDQEAVADLCNPIYNAMLAKLEEKFNK
jgi:hypothetical protein